MVDFGRLFGFHDKGTLRSEPAMPDRQERLGQGRPADVLSFLSKARCHRRAGVTG